MRKRALSALVLALAFMVILPLASVFAKTEKKQYNNFQEVAIDMRKEFEAAIDAVHAGDNKAAYEAMNRAYFGHYEVQGFEKYVMFSISKKRVSEIEAMFRDIKHSLLGNKDKENQEILSAIDLLSVKVYRDAMVLDGVADKDSPDEIGEVVLGGKEEVKEADPHQVAVKSFLTSFGLLLREGLEAILVCIAIVTYLIKTNNRAMVRQVYLGMLAGVLGSIALAFLIEWALAGAGQEMVEGWTMFLAVGVLFYVSHWMLHKSEEQAWEAYIQRQVSRSVDKKSGYVLVGAAFLAVIREGAELILFYKAALGGGGTNDKLYSIYGFLAGVAVLVVVWLIFRFTTVKLPLRPFFVFTSILLFVLCISFMGKGVQELTEAGVISGATTIPAMEGFTMEDLGIYDRAETLIPQAMLLISSAWILISSQLRQNRAKKEAAAVVAAQTPEAKA